MLSRPRRIQLALPCRLLLQCHRQPRGAESQVECAQESEHRDRDCGTSCEQAADGEDEPCESPAASRLHRQIPAAEVGETNRRHDGSARRPRRGRVYLAKLRTLAEFGEVNTAIAVAGVLTIVATVGLTDLGTRDLAVEPRRGGELAGLILTIRLVVLAAGTAVAVAVLALLGALNLELCAAGLAMALAMTVAADWILRGLESMRVLGLAWAAGGATVAFGAILVAWRSGSSEGALWAYAAGEIVVAAAGWLALRHAVRPTISTTDWRPLLERAWPIAISGAVIYAYTANLDTIILTATRSATEAGLYSAPYRVFWVLSAVVVFASYSLLPELSRRSAAGEEHSVRRAVGKMASVLCCYAIVTVGLCEIASGDGLGFLFGSSFDRAQDVFIVLSAGLAWYAIGHSAGQSLIASDRGRAYLWGAAAAGATNIGANLVAIPLFGPIGAAGATTFSFAVGSVVWIYVRGLARRLSFRLVGAAVLVTLGAIVAASLPGASVPVGLATVLAGLVASRYTLAEARVAW